MTTITGADDEVLSDETLDCSDDIHTTPSTDSHTVTHIICI